MYLMHLFMRYLLRYKSKIIYYGSPLVTSFADNGLWMVNINILCNIESVKSLNLSDHIIYFIYANLFRGCSLLVSTLVAYKQKYFVQQFVAWMLFCHS